MLSHEQDHPVPAALHLPPTYHGADIEELMRLGHPYLAETADAIVETVVRNALDLARSGREPRILEIGAASGILSSQIARRLPRAVMAAVEELPDQALLARR